MLFATGMIPADVDTFEKLVAWGNACLNFHGFGLQYQERPPNANFGDSGIQDEFERNGVIKTFNGEPRLVFRTSFLMANDYASNAYTMEYQAVQTRVTDAVSVDFINPAYTP